MLMLDVIYPKVNLDFWSSSHHCPGVGITDICHDVWFYVMLGMEPSASCTQGEQSTEWAPFPSPQYSFIVVWFKISTHSPRGFLDPWSSYKCVVCFLSAWLWRLLGLELPLDLGGSFPGSVCCFLQDVVKFTPSPVSQAHVFAASEISW